MYRYSYGRHVVKLWNIISTGLNVNVWNIRKLFLFCVIFCTFFELRVFGNAPSSVKYDRGGFSGRAGAVCPAYLTASAHCRRPAPSHVTHSSTLRLPLKNKKKKKKYEKARVYILYEYTGVSFYAFQSKCVREVARARWGVCGADLLRHVRIYIYI